MVTHLQAQPQLPPRVVVLGASGFVGGALARHLEVNGVETVGLASRQVDLLSPDSVGILRSTVRAGDALVIASALTPDKGKDAATLMRNLTMGQHVSAFVSDAALSHVVYVSSDAVYDDAANPVEEASPCAPTSFHGLMHLARERMLAWALQRLKTPLVCLRPTLLYGPGDTHNGYGPNRFLRSARQERRISLFGQGEERRDHCSVKDLSRLVECCLAHRSAGMLNVATGRSVSFAELARLIADLCEESITVDTTPRASPVTHRHFNIAELIKAFPSFRFTPLREALAESLHAECRETVLHG